VSGRRAIVTLAIGEGYAETWRELCEPSWRAYAERHGYELIWLTEPLDDSPRARDRSPSWQKLLVLEQPFARDFERIVWVDADVVFSEGAPDIAAGVPIEKVGAVDEFDAPTPQVKRRIYGPMLDGYYAEAGLDREFDQVVQAGVMVLSPAHHAEVLRRVYDSYEDVGLNFEMRPLSYELLSAGQVHWLDPRFNRLWEVQRTYRHPHLIDYPRHPKARVALREALAEVHLLHFAGRPEEMERLLRPPVRHPAVAARPAGEIPPVRAPVAVFAFARPDTTRSVLDAIRPARPSRLFVIADGPRPGRRGEAELCERTRAVFDDVDWDCEVSTSFAAEHMGITERIESGMDWVFERADEAILFEDDTVPDPTFFRFCDELLDRYRDSDRVLSIGGNNMQFAGPASEDSYYFSRYPSGPGIAMWRRSWDLYDPRMEAWPKVRDSGWLDSVLTGPHAASYWGHVFERTYREHDHWDYIWMFACWLTGGLHVTPNANQITNLGFRDDGTNVGTPLGPMFGDVATEPLAFPLTHPTEVAINERADAFIDRVAHGGQIADMFRRVRAAVREEAGTR
jgi:hypothetical protein